MAPTKRMVQIDSLSPCGTCLPAGREGQGEGIIGEKE